VSVDLPSSTETLTLGRPRLHLRHTGSTNDRARELAIAGAPHGTLVTASAQTAGRGRQGRRWWAPPDSALLASLVLRSPPTLLPLIAAVAVCDIAGPDAQIKWPNDIVIDRARAPRSFLGARGSDRGGHLTKGPSPPPAPLAKLAGILVEGRPQEGWAVLGIGLNVAVRLEQLPAELRPMAATLGLPARAIEPTLERLLAVLRRRLTEPQETILEAWRSRDALRGREIAWGRQGPTDTRRGRSSRRQRPERWVGHGRAEGIDGAGHLIVAMGDGARTTLAAGEVHLEEIG
jgi:BirA family transcriptional regulator, biotin operon repressor / biotin---[acetyl-CoA-carboxylase] ligase